MRIYTVHDSKAEAYLQPFFAANDAVAMRYLETAANDSGHEFARHAEDYTLFEIGGFDETTGNMDPVHPRSVTKIIDLIAAPALQIMPDRKEA